MEQKFEVREEVLLTEAFWSHSSVQYHRNVLWALGYIVDVSKNETKAHSLIAIGFIILILSPKAISKCPFPTWCNNDHRH